jgi:hypothetical protein
MIYRGFIPRVLFLVCAEKLAPQEKSYIALPVSRSQSRTMALGTRLEQIYNHRSLT